MLYAVLLHHTWNLETCYKCHIANVVVVVLPKNRKWLPDQFEKKKCLQKCYWHDHKTVRASYSSMWLFCQKYQKIPKQEVVFSTIVQWMESWMKGKQIILYDKLKREKNATRNRQWTIFYLFYITSTQQVENFSQLFHCRYFAGDL